MLFDFETPGVIMTIDNIKGLFIGNIFAVAAFAAIMLIALILTVISLMRARRSARELKAAHEAEARNLDLIKTMAADYTAIYRVDLNTDNCILYEMGERYSGGAGSSEKSFYSALNRFIEASVHPDDAEMLRAVYRSLKQRLYAEPSFSVFFRRDYGGKYLYTEMLCINVDRSCRTTNTAVVAFAEKDAAFREEAETRRQLSHALEQAQSASRAKTIFLNNMSHDIRTPMNAVIGFTNMALSHIDNKDQVKDCLIKIRQSSDHLLSLINDVLDMSRIESGKISLSEKQESISEIIDELCMIIKPEADAKALAFSKAADIKNDMVICDRLRLDQVFLNILANAVKYTPNGGSISFDVREQPSENEGEARYEFRVKDNGIGMSNEFLTTLFDPFTRVKSSTVSGIQGTGLGMSITKSIVGMMDGTIEVESTEDEGTDVLVVLELKIASADDGNADVSGNQDGSEDEVPDDFFAGMRVLLVEDNEINREIAEDILTAKGFEVDTAEDGTAALEKMEEADPDKYDLILMDVQMPVMDGYETTRRIRRSADPKKAGIPIVAMTANAFAEDRKLAFEAGMDEHVAKPIDAKVFFGALKSILKKNDIRTDSAESDSSEQSGQEGTF